MNKLGSEGLGPHEFYNKVYCDTRLNLVLVSLNVELEICGELQPSMVQRGVNVSLHGLMWFYSVKSIYSMYVR